MRIGGFIDISTKDIPNRAAMVVFTIGCNLNCGFCHNKFLLDYNAGKDMNVSEIMKKIKENDLVSSISISGGEPTLQPDIVDLCKNLKEIGKFVSIDTNGTQPDVIKNLLPYINRVALDIKGPFNMQRLNYITKSSLDLDFIIKTFHVLNREIELDFEIRTTYVENLMYPEDIHEIISWLNNHQFFGTFVLQQYQYLEGVGEKYKDKFQKPKHISLLNILKSFNKLELPFKIFLRDDVVGYASIEEALKK